MHPLTGQRLDLWRLKNFDGTQLPAAENTYLFHCVAKENPADERLVALAEIRDVTPLRDAAGRVVAFPAVERALTACLDGIRRQQARRRGERLDANRIFLYVWPTIEVSLDELGRLRAVDGAADGRGRARGDHDPGSAAARARPGAPGRRAAVLLQPPTPGSACR